MSVRVKVFGCRPLANGAAVSGGRRTKTSKIGRSHPDGGRNALHLYRASGLVLWHIADMAACPRYVRYPAYCGRRGWTRRAWRGQPFRLLHTLEAGAASIHRHATSILPLPPPLTPPRHALRARGEGNREVEPQPPLGAVTRTCLVVVGVVSDE
jgi:hypothetical protein